MYINAKPYDFPYNGDLTPANTALIVIDMQGDFCLPGGWCDKMGNDISRTASIIPNIKALLDAARGVPGFLIIHTREGHRADLLDLPANKLWRSVRNGAPIGENGEHGRYLTRGSETWDIVPQLCPKYGEPVVDKCGKGAFAATDLEQILKQNGIKNIIFTGVTAECCVHTTMRDANDLGYECVMLSDCVESTLAENYDFTVRHTGKTGLFGVLSDSQEVIKWLKSL